MPGNCRKALHDCGPAPLEIETSAALQVHVAIANLGQAAPAVVLQFERPTIAREGRQHLSEEHRRQTLKARRVMPRGTAVGPSSPHDAAVAHFAAHRPRLSSAQKMLVTSGGAVGAKEVVEEAAMDVGEGAVRILHVLDRGESLSKARFSARLEVFGDSRGRLCRRILRVMITSVVS